MQKDKTADQVLDIELEEPINKNRLNFDVLDDALYALNKASVVVAQQNITKAITVTKTVKNPA